MTPDDTAPTRPVVYQPAHEHAEADEPQAVADLQRLFVEMARKVADAEGHAHRAVHAKGQALLQARLQVLPGLPPPLAQGLFAEPARYDALLRFSSPPAEQLPDGVSTPRAVALKVVGVRGERVAESAGDATQDFLMVNGPAFVRPGPQGFLQDARLLALTTEKAPRAKKLASAVLRGAEAALEAVGAGSAKLRTMGGEPQRHPLGETYYSQTPFLYGDHIAKFSLAPLSPALTALKDRPLEAGDDDAQRDALNAFFASLDAPVEWEFRVQLCTDVDRMPVEDATVEWPQDASPYVAVARLQAGAQAAWDGARSEQREDALAFDPWHALAAHRPLGAVNRARRAVMAASRQFRSGFNGCPIHEPRTGGSG